MTVYTDTFDARGALYNSAMAKFPHARDDELNHLLNRLSPAPGEHIIDTPAGGGYVADALNELGAIVTCVEPSAEFGKSLSGRYQTHISPIWKTGIPDDSHHKLASLAGLHHLQSDELESFFKEAYRILKPGGLIVIADVARDTPAAEFLNGAVDEWTTTGHKGNFFEAGLMTTLLNNAGFTATEETTEQFHWRCPSKEDLLFFIHELFGMVNLDPEKTGDVLPEGMQIQTNSSSAELPWSLVFASARKP